MWDAEPSWGLVSDNMVSMASKMEATRLNSELMPEFQSRRTYVTEIRNRPNSYYADRWLVGGGFFNSFGSSSDRWHVPATPEVVSREVQFANGSAHLVGTLYLPKNGNHLPAVVVLHSAGAATREAGLYRHLREGLPAMGIRTLPWV